VLAVLAVGGGPLALPTQTAYHSPASPVKPAIPLKGDEKINPLKGVGQNLR